MLSSVQVGEAHLQNLDTRQKKGSEKENRSNRQAGTIFRQKICNHNLEKKVVQQQRDPRQQEQARSSGIDAHPVARTDSRKMRKHNLVDSLHEKHRNGNSTRGETIHRKVVD